MNKTEEEAWYTSAVFEDDVFETQWTCVYTGRPPEVLTKLVSIIKDEVFSYQGNLRASASKHDVLALKRLN